MLIFESLKNKNVAICFQENISKELINDFSIIIQIINSFQKYSFYENVNWILLDQNLVTYENLSIVQDIINSQIEKIIILVNDQYSQIVLDVINKIKDQTKIILINLQQDEIKLFLDQGCNTEVNINYIHNNQSTDLLLTFTQIILNCECQQIYFAGINENQLITQNNNIKKWYQQLHLKYPQVRYSQSFFKLIDQPPFTINPSLQDYVITLLGYNNVKLDGSRHTNWFPWDRFKHVFETIGYQVEWINLDQLKRSGEHRLFITWNEPTSLELYQRGIIKEHDIVFQKLTSLGKGMEKANWTSNPFKWCQNWSWPIYKTVEYLSDLNLNIYGFGCQSDYESFPEKNRICQKLKDRIFWISWGGTPFTWEQINICLPKMDELSNDITFVGSQWGRVGRGNPDAWKKYITPLENNHIKFKKFGGIGAQMVSNKEMISLLQSSKLCPILHAPSWQAEKGIQDRFYSVFISGRFGICDNLGAINLFGSEISEICTENSEEYYNKSIYYLNNVEEQLPFIQHIQKLIKSKYNFYHQWNKVLLQVKIKPNNLEQNITQESKFFIM